MYNKQIIIVIVIIIIFGWNTANMVKNKLVFVPRKIMILSPLEILKTMKEILCIMNSFVPGTQPYETVQ